MTSASQVIERLHAMWDREPRPDLVGFCRDEGLDPAVNKHASEILVEILRADLKNRWDTRTSDRTPPIVGEYLRCFPWLSAADRAALAAEELQLRSGTLRVPVLAQTRVLGAGVSADAYAPDIPGYSDLIRIGSGSLGVVYRARQLRTNRAVAIKLIRPELEVDEKTRKLFLREASIASRLHHPRIVSCLDFGFSGIRPYLVMELAENRSLEQLFWQHPPERRVSLAVRVVLQILEALMAAHEAGIVHRDIKPANVLTFGSGSNLRLKVSDFGLAKMVELAGQSGITGTGELCGTLAYMSPEQFVDSRNAQPECDVYAAVVCLFRLLTGEYPYADSSLPDFLRRRHSEDPRCVRRFNPHVPEPLARIISRGLDRNLQTRLRSAAALHQELKELTISHAVAKNTTRRPE